jgi:predicted nucleic acid-binding protein
MNIVLLDTNIVSYIYKQDSRALLYDKYIIGKELSVSLVTVAELLLWSKIRNWGLSRIRHLEETINNYTIFPVEFETCRIWANIRKERSDLGLPISPNDAWIAATALQYHLPLITHNPDDFQQITGLTIITEVIQH